jgi:hypothetical protein
VRHRFGNLPSLCATNYSPVRNSLRRSSLLVHRSSPRCANRLLTGSVRLATRNNSILQARCRRCLKNIADTDGCAAQQKSELAVVLLYNRLGWMNGFCQHSKNNTYHIYDVHFTPASLSAVGREEKSLNQPTQTRQFGFLSGYQSQPVDSLPAFAVQAQREPLELIDRRLAPIPCRARLACARPTSTARVPARVHSSQLPTIRETLQPAGAKGLPAASHDCLWTCQAQICYCNCSCIAHRTLQHLRR